MIIGTRSLKLSAAKGEVEVSVRVFKPELADGDWSCRFEIDWPDEKETMSTHGQDAVQALLLALQMIGSRLYASDEHKSGKLRWGEPGRGYGFPVMPVERGLLIGDDRKFV